MQDEDHPLQQTTSTRVSGTSATENVVVKERSVSVILLAGGKGKRMGSNNGLLIAAAENSNNGQWIEDGPLRTISDKKRGPWWQGSNRRRASSFFVAGERCSGQRCSGPITALLCLCKQASMPKQYLPLLGQPIALYSLYTFSQMIEVKEIVVVCDPSYRDIFEDVKEKINVVLKFSEPGKERQDSVYSGLQVQNIRC
ncbi:hypothetical protein Cgig2_023818 [Carnegiea gigantea]|uniref:Uncharacterized protein n=1 Tax=Carnegiea gigantea TaxID=171969 RepID=A0A9Q1JY08_9CARY|nr:hypothetical protein Cgig2_023818 [Carnegiea gigantea]